jgi:hypothetical protein
MLSITLYTQPACDLCQQVKDDLDSLAAEFPHTRNDVSILDDPQLFERYRYLIPVLLIGSQRLIYPFSTQDVRIALESQIENLRSEI